MSSDSKLSYETKRKPREILIRVPKGLMKEKEVVSFVKHILAFFNVDVQFVLVERGYKVKDVCEINIMRKYYYIRITPTSWDKR